MAAKSKNNIPASSLICSVILQLVLLHSVSVVDGCLLDWWPCPRNTNNDPLPESGIVNRTDIEYLASDELKGRDNLDPVSSNLAQEYLIDQLLDIGAVGVVGPIAGQEEDPSGRDAFRQVFPDGTNVIGIIEGSTRPNEYVVLSAHYDHFLECLPDPNSDSTVCNGATDNAAGVAIVLGMGRAMLADGRVPQRSVVLAIWDAEEDGLLGSKYFTENPLFPLEDIVSVLNYDIQGSNLSPSTRDMTFAIGSETGGFPLRHALLCASKSQNDDKLMVHQASEIVGQGRSDHASFTAQSVPIVFFTDASGPCYHTHGDEMKTLDFDKVETQAKISLQLAWNLANSSRQITFHTSLLPATYSDFVVLHTVVDSFVNNDLELYGPSGQAALFSAQAAINRVYERGWFLFPLALFEFEEVKNAVEGLMQVPITAECDGYLVEEE